jgi:uncharacterized protein YjbI with pentapeptide repeats
MPNPEHLAILMDGVEKWNRWRKQNPDIRPSLFSADLSTMGLERADFSWANLRLSKLRNCLLDRANFRGTDLEGADLSNSSAMNGIFSRNLLK